MPGNSVSSEQQREPDFERDLETARSTADFGYLLNTARAAQKLWVDFRDVVNDTKFLGRDTACVAQALRALDTIIAQGANQIAEFKKQAEAAEKNARAAKKETANA